MHSLQSCDLCRREVQMTVHHKGKWTPGEDQQLLELVAGGRSWLSIGLKLKRPTSSVRNRAYLLRRARASATENEEPLSAR